MKLRPLKWYRSLLTPKGRKKEGFYLVEGIRQVTQIIESSSDDIEEILLLNTVEFDSGNIPVRLIDTAQMKSCSDSETAPMMIAVMKIPDSYSSEMLPDTIPDSVLFLEDVQDPGNVGTLIRSAGAFGYTLVLMTGGCADPFSPKVVRSTAGAMSSVEIRRKNGYELLSSLKSKGYLLVTADIDGGVDSLLNVKRHIFALGNEGNGVSEKLLSLSDSVYTIPFDSNAVESLNVAIAGSIGMAQSYQTKVG